MDFKTYVHREAEKFRNEKTKEILSKSNPTELEKCILKIWSERNL